MNEADSEDSTDESREAEQNCACGECACLAYTTSEVCDQCTHGWHQHDWPTLTERTIAR